MKNPPPAEEPLRPHTYDGIQEYDHRLPNWWLVTLYGSIAFAALYWLFGFQLELLPEPGAALEEKMKANALAAARSSGKISNEILWSMSKDAKVVDAGRAVYQSTCASCHLPDLAGAIGPNLKDATWIHGSQPMDIVKVVTSGVLEKGMPTWGPVLGKTKINEVTAFILSHQPNP